MFIVSVPRRGFVVFLHDYLQVAKDELARFQSPEGDSLFFYGIPTQYRVWVNGVLAFQSPEGDSLFFYAELLGENMGNTLDIMFQSPEGESLFF